MEALLRDIFLKSARNLQFSRRLSGLTIQVSQGNREFPEGARMKEGDSIGVVHRHETSSADELGRCHPEWADVLQGSPFMQQCLSLEQVLPQKKIGRFKRKQAQAERLSYRMKGDSHNEKKHFYARSYSGSCHYCNNGCHYYCISNNFSLRSCRKWTFFKQRSDKVSELRDV